ncbi:MAG: magnesium transporter CorA family protein [archaeon]|nr:magnesium transporter CorA family protein [archaeon]
MIEYYAKKKGEDKVEKIPGFTHGCWINVIDPDEGEIEFLVNEFNLNKDDIHDGLDIYETARIEVEEEKTYIFMTAPTEKIEHEDVSSFLIISSKDFFMIISKYQLEIFDNVLDLSKKVGIFTNQRNLFKILFFISRAFEKKVMKIIKEAKANKRDLEKLKNEDIARIINYEDKLTIYISSFEGIIQNYNKILRNKSIKFSEKDQEMLKDIINDLEETFSLCKYALTTLTNMRSYYSTQLSNKLNKTVAILTISTIFLTVPMVLGSIYGMNVNLPLQEHPNIFYLLSFIVVTIWISMIFVLKHFKII